MLDPGRKMEATGGVREKESQRRPDHSVSKILRHDCDEEETDLDSESERRVECPLQGTKSAFKEVRKRKSRFNPIASDTGDTLPTLPARTSEARIIQPRLITNPYTALHAYGISAEGAHLASQYAYAARLGGPRIPAVGVAFRYGALPFFSAYPRQHRPTLYFRDPFVLAAQNCCAKCGVQFRMTSDLVYHMRTHHKQEMTTGDKRERHPAEKYRCTVCRESFKEKHHLSRHMTSHDV